MTAGRDPIRDDGHDEPEGSDPSHDPAADDATGLCARCRFATTQRSARGSVFWRCRRADVDPAYLRYPPLPVRCCGGFEPADPGAVD